MGSRIGATLCLGLMVAGGFVAHEATSVQSTPTAAAAAYVEREQARTGNALHGTIGACTSTANGSAEVAVHWDRSGIGRKPRDAVLLVERQHRLGGLVSGWNVVTSGSAPA